MFLLMNYILLVPFARRSTHTYKQPWWPPGLSLQACTSQSTTVVSETRTGPANFRSVYFLDSTCSHPVKVSTDSCCTRNSIRSDPATAVRASGNFMDQANLEVGVKSPSSNTALTEPADTTSGETTTWVIERVMAAHTVTTCAYLGGNW